MVLNVYISEAVCDELLRFLDPRDVTWLSTVARSTQQELGGLLRQRDLHLPEDLHPRSSGNAVRIQGQICSHPQPDRLAVISRLPLGQFL